MKVFVSEKDLVVGSKYYICNGLFPSYFVGEFPSEEDEGCIGLYFYSNDTIPFIKEPDGTFGFMIEGDEYEEV